MKHTTIQHLGFSLWAALLLNIAACSTNPALLTPEQQESRREAEMVSPFPSTIPNLPLPNAHDVVRAHNKKSGTVVRGMRPRNDEDIAALKKFGITDILVFREQKKGTQEIENLIKHYVLKGFDKEHVFHIPFHWKDISSFEEACVQTVEALKLMQKTALARGGKKLYVHCTVGEDRTGYLSAIYHRIFEKKSSDTVFKEDMCAWGYGDADPTKPAPVVKLVNDNITMAFAKMNALIDQGKFTKDSLDPEDCSFAKISNPGVLSQVVEMTARYSSCKAFTATP